MSYHHNEKNHLSSFINMQALFLSLSFPGESFLRSGENLTFCSSWYISWLKEFPSDKLLNLYISNSFLSTTHLLPVLSAVGHQLHHDKKCCIFGSKFLVSWHHGKEYFSKLFPHRAQEGEGVKSQILNPGTQQEWRARDAHYLSPEEQHSGDK